ncbi:N-acyl-D-amino-acid deacylase [Nonomuraea thailandensis]|uniref:N-acyl-D-amino-acid deacylase n=1 Tax=Nonomuraea thailandensis TaxID=1188745 RepID=A0A9X2K593_9ACTN|nr:amidohydrolase family protein [Nonomuraea thailandensis]MCP2360249.1 N-acyl-D-amino-acid deacylase [Nonomuraea thailandensis]
MIDATGLIVTPGLIDLHSHADFTVLGAPTAESCLYQGVTTLVTGNCGMSPFPGPSGSPWPDLAGFAAAVDAARPAVNLAPLVGHGALRAAVLGQQRRAPDQDELDRMRGLLATAAEQGAFGLSTGLIYAPGSFAATDEIEALAAVAARHDLLYATHMRDEGDRLIEAVEEALAVARASGVRLQISHLKAMGPANHGKVARALALMDAAAARGLDVACDVYPYTASSTTLTSRLPGWAMDGGTGALLARLADPATRERVLADLRPAVGRTFLPEGVIIAELSPGPYGARVGDSIAAIARDTGVEPAEAVLDVLAAHDAAVTIVNHAMAERDVQDVLRHPAGAVASDGWVLRAPGDGHPHPRNFGTFARVLGPSVRGAGVVPPAEAVRKMTALPATRLALGERGTVAPGQVADLAVFDPESTADHATYGDPWRYASGARHVLVAGELVLGDGTPTGARPGRTLLRTAPAR